ncbi:MAG: trypsin-like peptidase domain-containing protein [Planctomycetaceae bacterium]|nr:trypsin-like peptidase domain-containing protein [Planctomycetaceae bacterium]
MSRNLFPTRPGARLTGLLLAGVLDVWPARPSLVVAEDSAAVPEARRTETVRLIDRCLPAVVSIFAQVAGADGKVESRVGSGTIIHPAGFVLTNEHVVRDFRDGAVVLSDGRMLPMRVIAKFVHDDLAIVQVKNNTPLPTLVLGRSHDVLLGEPTLVIGSPGGLVHSVSTGIVSGVNRSTRNESNFLPWMIQTSAAVSRGNSGGPLINAVGEQIGVMATIGNDLQNVSFAIAIDHVREVLPKMLAMEQRHGIWLGADCDPLAAAAFVSSIEAESPAARAGLQAGDELIRVGELELFRGVDLQFALLGHRAGEKLAVVYRREGKESATTVTLGELPLDEPLADVELEPGLQWAMYRGEWSELPKFAELAPERTGHCTDLKPGSIGAEDENVGIRWSGLIKIPADDLYAFYTTSDDGSRLWIGERLVVDNDGLHPARENGGLIRLRKGLHPLRIEYFERSGAEFMEVAWEAANMPKRRLDGDVLFSPPEDEPADADKSDEKPADEAK